MSNYISGSLVVPAAAGGPSAAEKEFQDKMRDRMRQAMGDLMPDDVLQGIVARGIEEAFFQKRTTPSRNHWEQPKEIPSWTVEFIEKECKSQVAVAIQKWVDENQDKFGEIVKDVLGKGVLAAVIRAFDDLTVRAMGNLQSELITSIQRLRNGDRY